jgi:hypothetical protein
VTTAFVSNFFLDCLNLACRLVMVLTVHCWAYRNHFSTVQRARSHTNSHVAIQSKQATFVLYVPSTCLRSRHPTRKPSMLAHIVTLIHLISKTQRMASKLERRRQCPALRAQRIVPWLERYALFALFDVTRIPNIFGCNVERRCCACSRLPLLRIANEPQAEERWHRCFCIVLQVS